MSRIRAAAMKGGHAVDSEDVDADLRDHQFPALVRAVVEDDLRPRLEAMVARDGSSKDVQEKVSQLQQALTKVANKDRDRLMALAQHEAEQLRLARSRRYEHERHRPQTVAERLVLRSQDADEAVSIAPSPFFGVSLLVLAAALVLAPVDLSLSIWHLTESLNWPWRLLLVAALWLTSLSVASVSVLVADRHLTMSDRGQMDRQDGGTPTVTIGLTLATVAAMLPVLYVETLEGRYPHLVDAVTEVGAVVVSVGGLVVIGVVCWSLLYAAGRILWPLRATRVLGALALLSYFLILVVLLYRSSASALGSSTALVVWLLVGAALLGLAAATITRALRPRPGIGTSGDEPISGSQPGEEPRIVLGQLPGPTPMKEWRRQAEELRAADDEAAQSWQRTMRDAVLAPFLRVQINEIRQPGFSRTFNLDDDSGLQEPASGKFLVQTEAFDTVNELAENMGGGMIVLVGPRGAGKSTILLKLVQERRSFQLPSLAFSESAPVDYEPRDFALHLYSRLCAETISLVDRAMPRAGRRRLRQIAAVIPGPRGITAAGLVLVALVTAVSVQLHDWRPLAVTALLFGGALFAITERPWKRPMLFPDTEPASLSLDSLRSEAQRRLVQIRYQQRRTSGWSGKLTTGAVELGRNGSIQLDQQTLTYPEVVHAFRELLERIASLLLRERDRVPSPVLLAIDELDRLPTDIATQFILEIKALLPPVPGCLYLMSVSDEALNSLAAAGGRPSEDLRYLFDVAVRIEHLDPDKSVELLQSRLVGVPDPFLWLCNALAGGLPRELIRLARSTTRLGTSARPLRGTESSPGGSDLAAVARGLVAEELAQIPPELRAAADFTLADPQKLREIDSRSLLSIVRDNLSLLTTQGQFDGRQTRQPLIATVVQLYHHATVLEFFDGSLDDGQLRRAKEADYDISLDSLGPARRFLELDPRITWMVVNRVRRHWRLPSYDLDLFGAE